MTTTFLKASLALWQRVAGRRLTQYHEAQAMIAHRQEQLAAQASTAVQGVDVSSYQPNIDWAKAARAGVRFAFLKATEGQDIVDPSFTKARIAEARKAGVKVGAYHFLHPRPGRTGDVEAAHFLAICKERGINKPGDLVPVVDFEATNLPPAATHVYLGQFVAHIRTHTGRRPIIYTGGPFWDEHTGSSKNQWGCSLWLAAYVTNPNAYLPAAWRRWSVWQDTDKKTVPGIGVCDHNRSTMADLKRLTI